MDIAGNVLLETANLHARADMSGGSSEDRPPIYKVVGIILAVCSGLFIGVSFVVKKIGLLKANVKYNEEAGEGYGYLKNAWWWTGMILMIVGEGCNFAAYMFVDAIMVTPLGALSVVVTTILSAIFLKEKLSFVGKMSCFLAILGSVIIVLNAPEQSAVSDIQQMQKFVISPGFLTYTGIVIVGSAFTAFWAGPRYGKKTMMVYLTICSMVGGLSVVATQGLGAAIIAQINGKAQFNVSVEDLSLSCSVNCCCTDFFALAMVYLRSPGIRHLNTAHRDNISERTCYSCEHARARLTIHRKPSTSSTLLSSLQRTMSISLQQRSSPLQYSSKVSRAQQSQYRQWSWDSSLSAWVSFYCNSRNLPKTFQKRRSSKENSTKYAPLLSRKNPNTNLERTPFAEAVPLCAR